MVKFSERYLVLAIAAIIQVAECIPGDACKWMVRDDYNMCTDHECSNIKSMLNSTSTSSALTNWFNFYVKEYVKDYLQPLNTRTTPLTIQFYPFVSIVIKNSRGIWNPSAGEYTYIDLSYRNPYNKKQEGLIKLLLDLARSEPKAVILHEGNGVRYNEDQYMFKSRATVETMVGTGYQKRRFRYKLDGQTSYNGDLSEYGGEFGLAVSPRLLDELINGKRSRGRTQQSSIFLKSDPYHRGHSLPFEMVPPAEINMKVIQTSRGMTLVASGSERSRSVRVVKIIRVGSSKYEIRLLNRKFSVLIDISKFRRTKLRAQNDLAEMIQKHKDSTTGAETMEKISQVLTEAFIRDFNRNHICSEYVVPVGQAVLNVGNYIAVGLVSLMEHGRRKGFNTKGPKFVCDDTLSEFGITFPDKKSKDICTSVVRGTYDGLEQLIIARAKESGLLRDMVADIVSVESRRKVIDIMADAKRRLKAVQ